MTLHHTFPLLSQEDSRFYTGTKYLEKLVLTTSAVLWGLPSAYRVALERTSFEECLSRDHAFRDQRFLKTGKGKRFLRNRPSAHLDSVSRIELERL